LSLLLSFFAFFAGGMLPGEERFIDRSPPSQVAAFFGLLGGVAGVV
jgi:hypothetical protein